MQTLRVAGLMLIVFISIVFAQDECLDNAVARALVNDASQYTLTEPITNDDIINLIRTLAGIVKYTTSPYAIDLGVGYPDDAFFSVQTCNVPDSICFLPGLNNDEYYALVVLPSNGNDAYVYTLDSTNTIDLSSPPVANVGTYYPTQRPWYNVSGWSTVYPFAVVGYLGRSYQATQQSTNAHVISDRVSTEPCGSCLSLAPAVSAGDYLASSLFLASIKNLDTVAQVQNAVSSLLTQFLIPSQQSESIASIGVGFDNGDFYLITDCLAYYSADAVPECSESRYFAIVVNANLFGNNDLYYYALTTSGQVTTSARDGGSDFNTTSRPWFVLRSGWTDPYLYATSGNITSRSYAAPFTGGVVDVDPNVSNVCPTFASPSPSPSPNRPPPNYHPNPPPPSPSRSNRGTNINFNFANLLSTN